MFLWCPEIGVESSSLCAVRLTAFCCQAYLRVLWRRYQYENIGLGDIGHLVRTYSILLIQIHALFWVQQQCDDGGDSTVAKSMYLAGSRCLSNRSAGRASTNPRGKSTRAYIHGCTFPLTSPPRALGLVVEHRAGAGGPCSG